MKKSGTASAIRQVAIVGASFVLVFALSRVVAKQGGSEETQDGGKKATQLSVGEAGSRAIDLEVEPVRALSVEGEVKTTGAISTPADATVNISPSPQMGQGRIKEVLVNVGDTVRAGQTLATLESSDASNAVLTAEQSEVQLKLTKNTLDRTQRLFKLGTPDVTAAEAMLDQSKENLVFQQQALKSAVTAAEANLKSAQQRQSYAAKALALVQEQSNIGGFTDVPLETARNAEVAARVAVQQAVPDFNLATKELDRTRKLLALGLASDRDLVAAQDVFEKADAGLKGAREALDLAKEAVAREEKAHKTRLYANQQLETAGSAMRQADLDVTAGDTALKVATDQGHSAVRTAELQVSAADKGLALAKAQILRDLRQAQADFANATLGQANGRRVLAIHGVEGNKPVIAIKSPIGGQVVLRNVNPGQTVDTSTITPWQMFTISNNSRVWVDADVYDRDQNRVKLGQPVTIVASSAPGHVLTGKVSYIAPLVNATSHTVKVRTEILNPGLMLKSGQFADVTIHAGQGPRAVMIPADAMQVDGDESFVYVATPDHHYQKRVIHVGDEKNDMYVVRDGLKAGERIVTHGGMYLAAEEKGS